MLLGYTKNIVRGSILLARAVVKDLLIWIVLIAVPDFTKN